MTEFNNVTKPKHYAEGNIECIDAMESAYGIEAVMAFCKCNAFKYAWRFDKKNGIEDLKKAKWYIDKYIELDEKYSGGISDPADALKPTDKEIAEMQARSNQAIKDLKEIFPDEPYTLIQKSPRIIAKTDTAYTTTDGFKPVTTKYEGLYKVRLGLNIHEQKAIKNPNAFIGVGQIDRVESDGKNYRIIFKDVVTMKGCVTTGMERQRTMYAPVGYDMSQNLAEPNEIKRYNSYKASYSYDV